MADRIYRPGSRQRRFHEGRISDARLAWLQTYIGQFVLMYYKDAQALVDDGEEASPEPGPTIRLMLPSPRGRGVMFNITALTSEELAQMRELFEMMFDMAEPIVKERDKAAQDAFDRGDDGFHRIYRQVPRLVVREGVLGSDGEGVQQRHDESSEGRGPGGDDEGPVHSAGTTLADGEASDRGAEDDHATPD